MRPTGIVRRIDQLGRVVVPIETRRMLGIETKDPLELYVDEDKMIYRKYAPACIFCEEANNIEDFKGKNVCADCRKDLKALA